MPYIEVEQFAVTVEVTVRDRVDWDTSGKATMTIDVSSLSSIPKVGTITDGLTKAAIDQHLLKTAEKIRLDAIPALEEVEG